MASEGKGAGVRSGIGLKVEDIVDALNDSDLDFSGDDCDEDPEFLPPELTQKASYHETSQPSSSDENYYALILTPASPALSDSSSSRPRLRGRGPDHGRGTKVGEGSQQTQSSSLSIAVRNRQTNNGVQDTWTKDTLEPEINLIFLFLKAAEM